MIPPRPTELPPEILDHLPPASPDAIASRRDLRLFNTLLGNERWLRATLKSHVRPGETIGELGAGTGELAVRMVQAGFKWEALDLVPPPPSWPTEARWIQGDFIARPELIGHDVVAANLVVHHFDAATLRQLGARVRTTARVVAIADIRRSPSMERNFRWLTSVARSHPVSRHDGVLSIRAGFDGDELQRALGLDGDTWNCRVSYGLTGAYRLLAIRRA